jgi:polyphosphate kinase
VEDPESVKELRFLLDTQLNDQRGAWEMLPDGSYVQRDAANEDEDVHCQEALIAWAEKRYKLATRLKRRKPQGISKQRNVRQV